MCLDVCLYLVMINVFLLLSFFSRTLHEVLYRQNTAITVLLFSLFYLYFENWLFVELALSYFYHYGIIPYFYIYTATYLIFNLMEWAYQDEEEI